MPSPSSEKSKMTIKAKALGIFVVVGAAIWLLALSLENQGRKKFWDAFEAFFTESAELIEAPPSNPGSARLSQWTLKRVKELKKQYLTEKLQPEDLGKILNDFSHHPDIVLFYLQTAFFKLKNQDLQLKRDLLDGCLRSLQRYGEAIEQQKADLSLVHKAITPFLRSRKRMQVQPHTFLFSPKFLQRSCEELRKLADLAGIPYESGYSFPKPNELELKSLIKKLFSANHPQ